MTLTGRHRKEGVERPVAGRSGEHGRGGILMRAGVVRPSLEAGASRLWCLVESSQEERCAVLALICRSLGIETHNPTTVAWVSKACRWIA